MVILVASNHIVEKDLLCGEAFDHGYKEREIKNSQRSIQSDFNTLFGTKNSGNPQFLENVNVVKDYSY